MKKGRQWMLLLCTLLLTAAGAAAPYLVSAVQETHIKNLRESRLLNEVSLTLQKGEDVQDVLRLLASPTSDLEWRGKTNLTEEEAAGAAEDVLCQMNENGLIALPLLPLILEESEQYKFNIHTEPHIIMSQDESSLSAVVWLCWTDEFAYNFIYIDDETGKMVRSFLDETGFINTGSNHSAVGGDMDLEESVKRAEQWRVFLSAYYGTTLIFDDSEDTEVYDDGYSIQFPLTFDSGEGKDSGTVMRLELKGTAVFFNF